MKKRILVLSANPRKDSFVHQLALTYSTAAQKNNEVKILELADMDFNADLSSGYEQEQTMEASLKAFQDALKWCDHLVICAPVWWGALPAKLKGLIDRTFLPGFAFQYEEGKLMPEKLLKGKTARLILTMDTPPWYYVLIQRAPVIHQLKKATLEFVGFTAIKSKMIGPVISSSINARSKWLNYTSELGHMGK